jgi:hypothetical protein
VTTQRKTSKKEKYPWSSIELGDFFKIEGLPLPSIRSSAYVAGLRHKRRFRVNLLDHESALVTFIAERE